MNILGYMQKVGKALMVPVATLPAAAILMGIGYWLDPVGWGSESILAAFLIKSGAAIIDNMAVLFAVGVSFGLSRDKNGSAALSGFVCFLVVTTLLDPGSVAQLMGADISEVPAAFGKINNQFIGIIIGILSAEIYNRYSTVELPQALAFFSGKRLVPILTSIAGMLLSFALLHIWPFIYDALILFGIKLESMGAIGAGLFGFFNRLFLSVGMHHALYPVFWFDVVGINDIPNFLGGAQSIANGTAVIGKTGMYQAGFFPVMMFGLPAAALAMYHCADAKNKSQVFAIMVAAAMASFFTGITEPLEFSFMFLAPALYLVHAILTGLSLYIAASMEWMAGFGFSAGFVDFVLSSQNPLANKWYMLILQGLVFFGLYYSIFRFAIIKFNLPTPGRGEQMEDEQSTSNAEGLSELTQDYIEAIGGAENILEVDNCITRLRLTVKDSSLADSDKLKKLGAAGVVKIGKGGLQVIIGLGKVDKVAEQMKVALAN
ncbi:N-acetylglucosamine-specific PTS transporter subunit IIBC [Vibrio genomosp. F10]|uniref:PTS glucose transporter subunit IIBC n=2 Tax=Vibrio genomosp. F10 TaxID=723171 RepID=A0A1B9QY29_9VIBR|nr:N-acetylglucosamine-specific PTS transporter subunit IIBC [Vibrio genomosp. F10]OCH75225.1 PTS glucose transporter subunit IIBC [Vibrio genomosp. F10]OEE36961.1 PTS glucose transporter subunit IIBC [Vibrio genomosp. F10 str. ZF-129]OEE95973.1 PTS glucose transporter subunit IIBC [Vibrio genomosp. F10 str. 9ZC157]OEF04008.1 PTS glucose transporter subunit IIBC [Vibrio genomosp. F10 str. 9ZB36]